MEQVITRISLSRQKQPTDVGWWRTYRDRRRTSPRGINSNRLNLSCINSSGFADHTSAVPERLRCWLPACAVPFATSSPAPRRVTQYCYNRMHSAKAIVDRSPSNNGGARLVFLHIQTGCLSLVRASYSMITQSINYVLLHHRASRWAAGHWDSVQNWMIFSLSSLNVPVFCTIDRNTVFLRPSVRINQTDPHSRPVFHTSTPPHTHTHTCFPMFPPTRALRCFNILHVYIYANELYLCLKSVA